MRAMSAIVAGLVLASAFAACSTAAPPAPSADPTLRPAASYEEFALNGCQAFISLFRAVGNPDTGELSELRRALAEAAKAKDVATAQRVAAQIAGELEVGRRHAAAAAGWQPGAPMMAALDRVLAAFIAMTAAEAASALDASADPQAAFEAAGGVQAWQAMFAAGASIEDHRPATGPTPCPGVPVSL